MSLLTRPGRLGVAAAAVVGVATMLGGSVAHADVDEQVCLPLEAGGEVCTRIQVEKPAYFSGKVRIVGITVSHSDASGEPSSGVLAAIGCQGETSTKPAGQLWLEATVLIAGNSIVDESSGTEHSCAPLVQGSPY